jgi:hypothetical protein
LFLLTITTGRPWFASELRHKSFKDLHTLWYVCLREKNLLATQKEEVRRMGVANPDFQVSGEKVRDVRACFLILTAMMKLPCLVSENHGSNQGCPERTTFSIPGRRGTGRERACGDLVYTRYGYYGSAAVGADL